MSFNSDRFTVRTGDTPHNHDVQDDSSANTHPTGTGTETIDPDLTELTIRFEFMPMNNEASKQIALVHTKLLIEMQTTFQEDMIIFNNKNARLGTIDLKKWSSPTMHQRNFKIHVKPGTQRRRSKHFIIHRILTNQSLSTIRYFQSINSMLKANDCYLRNHAWEESVWDTVQAGYYINLNPQHYSPTAALAKIQKEVAAKNPKSKLPMIRLIYASPSNNQGGRNHRSKAYAIEFSRTDAAAVIRILKDTYRDTNRFLLAKMRFTNPEAFSNAIKMQNHHLAANFVLPMLNIPEPAMFYLKERLVAIPGVCDVVATRHTDTIGRYNIIVAKEHFKNTKQWLLANFEEMYSTLVPPDATSIGVRGQDDDSSGDQSFLSMSALSFTSIDTASFPDNFDTFPPSNQPHSWSAITQGSAIAPIPAGVEITQGSEATSNLSEVESLKQQVNQLTVTNAAARETDRETIQLLREAFERQEAAMIALQSMLTTLGPSIAALQALQAEASAGSTVQPAEGRSTQPDAEMQEAASKDNAKRDKTEELMTQESPKRQDARPSPGRQNFQ